MSRTVELFLLILAPALAIFLGCLGLETRRDNVLGWFLLVIGISYPVGGIAYYWVRRRPFWRPSSPEKVVLEEKGDRSFWIMLPGCLALFFVPPLEFLYLPAFLPRTIWMQGIGTFFLLAAMVLRIWSRTSIRGFYCGHVEVQRGQALVQHGPYRYIRHPGYAGLILMALSICVGYSSLLGLLAIPVLLLPGLIYRLGVEEKLLNQHFGDEFLRYKQHTRRLFPGIW